MNETQFPISEYFKNSVITGETISKGGSWWTAALLIKDPKNEQKYIALYRWQLTDQGWKLRKQFPFKDKLKFQVILKALLRLAKKNEWDVKISDLNP